MYETSQLMAENMNVNGFRRPRFQVHHLPPGYRFQPTDQELLVYYLHKKVEGLPLPINFITDVDVYKFNPQTLCNLHEKYLMGEGWYFFTPREKKYPNGKRPKRSAGNGYWKATGADTVIKDVNSKVVGSKQSLVFYEGKAPKGKKTDWIMYEYKVPRQPAEGPRLAADPNNKMRLDDWVLCRINNNEARGRRVVAASNNTMEDGIEPVVGAEEIDDVPGFEPYTSGQEMVLAESSNDFDTQGFLNSDMDDLILTEPVCIEGPDTPVVVERRNNSGLVTPVEERNVISAPVTPMEETMLINYNEIGSNLMPSYSYSEQFGYITNDL